MILRIGVLVLGVLLFVSLGWGAIATWATVFTEGAGTPVATSGPGSGSGEAPAIVGAIVFTVFALLAGAAAIVSGYALAGDRAGGER